MKIFVWINISFVSECIATEIEVADDATAEEIEEAAKAAAFEFIEWGYEKK